MLTGLAQQLQVVKTRRAIILNMDPGRQNVFFGTSEDRSIPMFYSKAKEDVIIDTEINPKLVSINEKPCMCLNVVGKTMCNVCLSNTVDHNWKNQHDFNNDCGKSDNNKSMQDGSMYPFTNRLNNKKNNISINKPYWPQKKPGYINGIMATNSEVVQIHMEKHKPPLGMKKNYGLETFFHHEKQLLKPLDSCCRDHGTCNEKYSLKDDSCRHSQIAYIPFANTTTPVNNINHNSSIKMESSRKTVVDQHVVNPSNMLATKEHATQNDARICPQILTSVEPNSCHSNLYVSPPKFSSEKFTNANSKQKISGESTSQEYRPLNSSSSHPIHTHSEIKNRRESPVQISTPIMTQLSSQSSFPPSQKLQNISYTVNPTSNNIFYTPSVSNVQTPEMTQLLLNQSHALHEYTSTLSETPSNVFLRKNMHCVAEDCVKKEAHIFDIREITNQSLFPNPYKPIKSDQYCSEQISEFEQKSTIACNDISRDYLKTNRMCSNKCSSGNFDYTFQPIHSSTYSNSPYYYENQSLRYESNAHGLCSPALATTPTSSLPATSQIHTQLHHNMYVTQAHHTQPVERYQEQPSNDFVPQSNNIQDIPHVRTIGGLNIQENQQPRGHVNTKHKLQQSSNAQHFSLPAQIIQSTKRSQTKPNYRELINHVYAMRNSTSEEELNLQIIKKTLNVDPQITRPHVISGSVLAQTPMRKVPYSESIQYPNVQTNVLTRLSRNYMHKGNILTDLPADQSSLSSSGNVLQEIKQGKPCSFSPLDLSMRTIKTKADSTGYSRKGGTVAFSTKPSQRDTKYALPKVDFMPNFSLHTNTQGTNVVHNSQTMFEKHKSNSNSTSHHYESADQPSLQNSENTSTEAQPLRLEPPQKKGAVYKIQSLVSSPPPPILPIEIKNKLSKISENFQKRPSVLEENPYAQTKLSRPQKEFSINLNNISVLNKTSPDISITPLSKIKYVDANITPAPSTYPSQTKTAYRIACERNPNFLGRKRHLHEYTTNIKYNQTPLNKIPRITESESLALEEKVDKTINEHNVIVCVEQTKTPTEPSIGVEEFINNPFHSNTNTLISKQEAAISTNETVTMPLPAVVKLETSLIAARIRTKAELKGFTFNTISVDTCSSKELRIKEEYPAYSDNSDIASIQGPTDNKNHSNLIDINWSNACNDFVEQLLNNSKKPTKCDQKLDKSNYNPSPLSRTLDKTGSFDIHLINEDSQDLSLCTNDSDLNAPADDTSMTFKSISQDDTTFMSAVIQKKCSKLEREKMRQQQEKRIAARLQKESSSESENETHKRLSERLKKPLKRGKLRGAIVERKHFSDCGSDSSTDVNNHERHTKITKKDKIVKDLLKNDRFDKKNSENNLNTSDMIENLTENESVNYKIRNNRKIVDVTGTTDSKNEDLAPETKIEPQGIRLEIDKQGHLSSKVQYGSSNHRDNNVYSKQIKKSKLHSKKIIGLNTMTRSKRKRELELQLANSKVLRNDKIIRNSTTKIKRKYVRKFSNLIETNTNIANAEQEQFMSTRLRSKSEKHTKMYNNLNNSKITYNKKSDSITNKEHQTDIFLEVYRYKRSLKVPASLISIKHPSSQRISSSLTDLEQEGREPSTSSVRKSRVTKNTFLTMEKTPTPKFTNIEVNTEPRSIIDLLHSRVIKSNTRPNVKSIKVNTSNSSIHTHSETSQTTESNSVGLGELLPIPKKEIAAVVNEGKKRHFSIFDTKVLKTKTRTESKLQQKKEIIREIFVGHDRPASAPPEMTQPPDGGEKMTYEQKYEQFLQQMNIVINEEKLRKFGRTTTSISSSMLCSNDQFELTVKHGNDGVINDFDVGEKLDCQQQQDNISIASGTNNCFRRRRPAKYLRRKGSSGFDYIRKKKKPSQFASSNNNLVSTAVRTERNDEEVYGKIKTESDVCREIQKWVLNKGVGQSTMHKAARLGYIDVIVYCLDRMGLNPDQKDNAGYTPLHEACTNGRLEIARVLLQYGANHSEAAHSGIRPLHEASENDNLEIVRMLLSYGADPLLATYSGQTPLMLASSNSMKELISYHLHDVQASCTPWLFNGPWYIIDDSECGFNTLGGAPSPVCDTSKSIIKNNVKDTKKLIKQFIGNSSEILTNSCAVLLNNMNHYTSVRLYNDMNRTDSKSNESTFNQPEFLRENSDSDGEIFEFEEADILLPPLYLLKDEGMDKWVLLNDLCNLLKVKSKDTLLNKIYPSSISTTHKSLIRELKMSDFLEKATCLQLLCAGEKINICASKVVLIKYNDNVRNLLGVKTMLMKF